VPALLVDYAMRNTQVPVGFWRCVNHPELLLPRELSSTELAHAAGADPYRYRRNLIGAHKQADKLWACLTRPPKRAAGDVAARRSIAASR